MAESKRREPDPAARWKKLSPSSRLNAVLRLIEAVKGHEASLITYPDKAHGGQLNRTKVKTMLAQNRAVLAILRAILEPELWDAAIATLEFDPFDPAAVVALRVRIAKQLKAMVTPRERRPL